VTTEEKLHKFLKSKDPPTILIGLSMMKGRDDLPDDLVNKITQLSMRSDELIKSKAQSILIKYLSTMKGKLSDDSMNKIAMLSIRPNINNTIQKKAESIFMNQTKQLRKFINCTNSKKAKPILEKLDDWMLASLVIWKEVNTTQKNWITKKLSFDIDEVFLKQWKMKKIKGSDILNLTGHFKAGSYFEIQVCKRNTGCRGHSWPNKKMGKGDVRLSMELINPDKPYYRSSGQWEDGKRIEGPSMEISFVTYHYCAHCISKRISFERRYAMIAEWWLKALKGAKFRRKKEMKEAEKQVAKKEKKIAIKAKIKTVGPLSYLADVFKKSPDPNMKKMGVSMKKGEISDDALGIVLWMYMFHEDANIRSQAKKVFLMSAPDDAKKVVKENWKASYRKIPSWRESNIDNISNLATKLEKTPISLFTSLINYLTAGVKINKQSKKLENEIKKLRAVSIRNKKPFPIHLKKLQEEFQDLTLANQKLKDKTASIPTPFTSFVEAVVVSLEKIGDKRAVPVLIKLFRKQEGLRTDGKSSDTRRLPPSLFIKALVKIGDKRAIKPIINELAQDMKRYLYATRSSPSAIRNEALAAIVKFGDSCAVKPLIKLIETYEKCNRLDNENPLLGSWQSYAVIIAPFQKQKVPYSHEDIKSRRKHSKAGGVFDKKNFTFKRNTIKQRIAQRNDFLKKITTALKKLGHEVK